MSLLNLLHQSVVLKFTDAAKPQYDPGTGYVFRLVGVDGMGFLQLQDDLASVAYWYQTLPAVPFPVLPPRDYLQII